MQLLRIQLGLEAIGARIIAVSPDSPEAMRAFWEEQGLPFVGIPDPDGSLLARLGQETNWWRLGRMPGAVVVDRQGRIRWEQIGRSMRDYPTPEETLHMLALLKLEQDGHPAVPAAGSVAGPEVQP